MTPPPPGHPPPPAPTARPPKRDPRRILGVVLLVAGLVGAGLALWSSSAVADEVVLTGVSSAGTDPFVAGGTVTPAPAAAPNLPAPPAVPRTGTGPTSYPGTSPGLYGGVQGGSTCNTDQIIGYLEANPEPAAVWARVPRIPPSAIRAYLTGLTPVILRTDTQVTSFGLRADKAIPRQVVLQSGTSVLVDPSGAPRVRCGSGNPLDQARIQSGSGSGPTYRGTPWPRFSPTTVIVIAPTRPIGSIIIVDLGGGTVLIRIPGDVGRDVVITVLPALLRPGDPIVVRGRRFAPGALVTVRFDVPAVILGVTNADGGGTIATTVAVPAGAGPGVHVVTAEGAGARNVLPVYILAPDA